MNDNYIIENGKVKEKDKDGFVSGFVERLIAIIVCMGLVFGLVLGLAIGLLTLTVKAFVLVKMWAWFIAPYFGLPILSIPLAIGISLIIGMFYPIRSAKPPEIEPSLI